MALPKGMSRLTGLQKWDLSHCSGLKTLPESKGRQTGLQELDLSSCSGQTALPEWMGSLTGLQSRIYHLYPRISPVPNSDARALQ
jgi:hypothetical protein